MEHEIRGRRPSENEMAVARVTIRTGQAQLNRYDSKHTTSHDHVKLEGLCALVPSAV